jgi:YHS domain-containing protein
MTGWILKIIVFLLVLRLVLRFVMGLLQGLAGDGGSRSNGSSRASQPLVRDPVCGTYVPRSRALTVGSGETTRYFCSEQCRETYAKHA